MSDLASSGAPSPVRSYRLSRRQMIARAGSFGLGVAASVILAACGGTAATPTAAPVVQPTKAPETVVPLQVTAAPVATAAPSPTVAPTQAAQPTAAPTTAASAASNTLIVGHTGDAVKLDANDIEDGESVM